MRRPGRPTEASRRAPRRRRPAGESGQAAKLAEVVARLLERRIFEPAKIVLAERLEDPLDAQGLRRREPAGPDRVLDLRHRRVADRRPRREALTQSPPGHVAVAVVRVLGEHCEDQLVDRRAVRAQHRTAVLPAESVADRAQPAAVGHARGWYEPGPWRSRRSTVSWPGSKSTGSGPGRRRPSISTASPPPRHVQPAAAAPRLRVAPDRSGLAAAPGRRAHDGLLPPPGISALAAAGH